MNATSTMPGPSRPIDKLLLGIERAPFSALYRIVLGFLLVPVFYTLGGDSSSTLGFLLFFLGTLIMLRAVPLVLRKVLPFSNQVQAAWFRRRSLSKQYDSFQWRKLFWIGLGLAGYSLRYGDWRSPYAAVAVVCIVGGLAALWIWRGLGIDDQ